jgi:hypothetical protein
MLKKVLETLEGLTEEVKGLYKKEADGKFHLQLEAGDDDTKRKLDEFRENNIRLQKERDELLKKFAGIDLEEIAGLKKRLQEIDDKKMLDSGKIDELVAQRVERIKSEYENQVKKMKEALDEKDKALGTTTQKLSTVLIDSEITRAVNSVGVIRKEAMRDILARGREIWRLDENGKPIPKEGDHLLYGKDGKASLTFDEWAKTLLESAPFLFEGSAGGGAGGGRGDGSGFVGGKPDLSKLPPQERLKYLHSQGGTK